MRRDGPALLFAILFPPAAAWLYFVALAGHPTMPYLYAACKAVQFAFPAAWILAVERTPVRWHRPNPGSLRSGAVSGLVLGVGLVGFHRAAVAGTALEGEIAHGIFRKTVEIGAGTPARYLALVLFLAFLHSWLEEYYWRGFVFARLRDRLGFRLALPAGSLAFAAHHGIVLHVLLGPGHGLAAAGLTLGVAAAGGLWAVLFHRHGGLAAPWVSHALADLAVLAVGFRMIRGWL